MQYWPLRPGSSEHSLNLGHTANLLARIGVNRSRFLAADLLQVIGPGVPLAQCTIFAYPKRRNPEVFSFADRAREVSLPVISSTYVQRFFGLDGNQQVMNQSSAVHNTIVQRQSIEDIAPGEYRRICYEQPQISERVALLTHCESNRWLSVNFYRGREHGRFSEREVNYLETLAPLLIQAVRLHYHAYLQANEMPLLLAERVIRQQHVELTLREQELLRLMLSGLEVDDIAEHLGVRPVSAATYVKRLYRKLGINGLRELFGLATRAEWA
ncbi:response regulator transcription factor [Pseudomonas alkylphenolica]|uniref:response regulator transcription factor n=1 Tax=Pseudomonas alkylphenolica TaxID=237609 RepID=UPI0018D9A79D|nr:helix-turn-helix transcriptional regulator [Pseudomonas alkylphenolica]MBH3426312.1 helix-turn-helix transcriptional regulator [Pseudomonas alkylphenolica]